MVDDSIVRGTTCANIIKMLKNAGDTRSRVESAPRRFYIRAISEQMFRQMIS